MYLSPQPDLQAGPDFDPDLQEQGNRDAWLPAQLSGFLFHSPVPPAGEMGTPPSRGGERRKQTLWEPGGGVRGRV